MNARGLARGSKKWMDGLLLAFLMGAPGDASAIERLRFKPGFNLFSPQQDVQVGREAAAQADKQLPLVNDAEVLRYVNDLGHRLAQVAPVNSDYPWTFKVVNSRDINAFALPGGFIYVNRGVIEAAEDEAQIAGVMAHEMGHVVMRHGTHQASQMMMARAPLAILGGLLGQSSTLTSELLQLGIGFTANSIFLKNSRGVESQADEVGTYILYHAGYDPRAMAEFFQIIEKKYPQRTMEFFSDHPNPENRIHKVDELIPLLGPSRQGKTDSPEFQAVKSRLLSLPPPPKGKAGPRASVGPSDTPTPPTPSSRLVRYQGEGFAMEFPENWKAEGSGGSVSLAPPGGVLAGPEGESAQAYGASVSRYRPPNGDRGGWGLVEATQAVVETMRQSNPGLRVLKQTGIRVSGRPALSTLIENDSPIEGQKERDHLVTVRADNTLIAVIFVAPEPSLGAYQPTFEAMLRSLELR